MWKLDPDRFLVATTDFFTPVVDTPYDYGAIAAANALSDVYAMGARPFLALNVAAFPPDMDPAIIGEILLGGAEKIREAGAVLAGGHTIQDKEPKFGLVVLGFGNPNHMFTKSGAAPGDKLVLSKPLGFGVVTTALKQDRADPSDVSEAVGWMKRLNREASELGIAFDVRGGTDITGYSLMGHSLEIANASGVRLRFEYDRLPFTRGARDYAQAWVFPGGAYDNLAYYGAQVSFDPRFDDAEQMLLFDPQTSGGLLLSVPGKNLEALVERAAQMGQLIWPVGEVLAGEPGIEVI